MFSRSFYYHFRSLLNNCKITFYMLARNFKYADISIFHKYQAPPGGGGHQFIRALWREFERRGLLVENNTISHTTRACLFNSFNFDFARLRRMRREGCRMVHRVDGPIGVYRGWDNGTDLRIQNINNEIADATVFQSYYSLRKHQELGLDFKSPCVIMNAANPRIFHPQGRITFDRNRKTRLLSSSWSDNPNKGTEIYKWIEEHLNWDRFEYSFVGRSKIQFSRIRMIEPVTSLKLAELLREHDIYITASRNDPCSNGLIEALACGLPALYLNSGGHPEIVGEAGLCFSSTEEIPALLDRIVCEYTDKQNRISLPTLEEVAKNYLSVMGIGT